MLICPILARSAPLVRTAKNLYNGVGLRVIRLLHFADLHLGVENYSRIDPATGLSTCFGDFLATLDEVVGDAPEEQQPAIVRKLIKARTFHRI